MLPHNAGSSAFSFKLATSIFPHAFSELF